ncbi:hypothetical protein [Aromatoleum sp.]|uniref:hypothetical protein n=1 Tax=Aromatoleum sp. TaxID=2307007 RepID=UPI002FC715A7
MIALPELLASFASAFTQAQRVITLELGDGSRHPRQLLPQTVVGEEGRCHRRTGIGCDASRRMPPSGSNPCWTCPRPSGFSMPAAAR